MTMNAPEREEVLMAKKDASYFRQKIGLESVYKCELTIPLDYVHEKQLEVFCLENFLQERKFSVYDRNMNDYNCRLVTNRLIPGKTYVFEFYPILRKIPGQDCLDFLYFVKSLMIGAQGLTFLWGSNPEPFTKGRDVVSFDKESSLRLWRESRMVPFIHSHQKPKIQDFATTPFEEFFGIEYLLLVTHIKK